LLANSLPRTILSSATLQRSQTLEALFASRFQGGKIMEFSASGAYISHVYIVLDFDPAKFATCKASYCRRGSFIFTSNPRALESLMINELVKDPPRSCPNSKKQGSKDGFNPDYYNYDGKYWINTLQHRILWGGENPAFNDYRDYTGGALSIREACGITIILKSELDIQKVFQDLEKKQNVFNITNVGLCDPNSPFVGLDLSETIKDVVVLDDFAAMLSDSDLHQLVGRFGRNGNTCNVFASAQTLERIKNFSRENVQKIDPFRALSELPAESQAPKPIIFQGCTFLGASRSEHCIDVYLARTASIDENTKFYNVENFSDLEITAEIVPAPAPVPVQAKKPVDEDDWEESARREERKKAKAKQLSKRQL
jgi:hypothetical protein